MRRPAGTRRGERRGALALLCAALLCSSPPAAAEEVRTVRTSRSGDTLTVAFSISDLLDEAAQEELESGLPTRIALRITLRSEDAAEGVRASIRTCEVTYDLWDEVFHVHIEDERQSKWYDATSRNDALRLCTVVRDTRIDVTGLPTGSYVVGVVAELNPVSTAMLEGLVRRHFHQPPDRRSGPHPPLPIRAVRAVRQRPWIRERPGGSASRGSRRRSSACCFSSSG
jgi:hypothetical protein